MNSIPSTPGTPDDYYNCQGSLGAPARLRSVSTLSSISSESKRGSADRFNLDVLLPNGVLLQMVVEQTISVCELKQIILDKIFETTLAHSCPRVGLMTNSTSFYTLEYICQQGKRVRVEHDEAKLFQLNMALPLFKMISIEEGIKNVETETDIGLLIGRKLSTFESTRSPEVNDFRWSVKVFASDIAKLRQTRLSKSWRNAVGYQHPAQRTSITTPLVETSLRLKNNMVLLSVQHNEKTMIRTVNKKILPSALIVEELGISREDAPNFCLQILGREEYLVEDHPLCTFSSVLEDLVTLEQAFLVLRHKDTIPLEVASDAVYPLLEKTSQLNKSNVGRKPSMNRKGKPFGSSMELTSSWDMEEILMIEVGRLKLRPPRGNELVNQIPPTSVSNCIEESIAENGKGLFLRVAIFHGTAEICPKADFPINKILTRDDNTAMELLQKSRIVKLDIQMCQLPRMARICFCVFHERRGTKTALTWVNMNIFNYQRRLRRTQTLHMWEAVDQGTHNLLNPLKTSRPNFTFEEASSMEVNFITGCSVKHPPDEIQGSRQSLETIPRARSKTLANFAEELKKISDRDPLHTITVQEHELLWKTRWDCRAEHPTVLPRIVDCVDYRDRKQVAQLHQLLASWPEIPLEKALHLLDYAYPDERVHEYAVRCLEKEGDEKLELYMSQLVQAIKHQNFYDSALSRFLLKRSLNNQRLGHSFFWSMRSELKEDMSTLNQALLLEAYLLAAPEHLQVLLRQRKFLSALKSINDTITLKEQTNTAFPFEKRKEVFMTNIKRNFSVGNWEGFISPQDPGIVCKDIQFEECSLMKSKKKPQKIVFKNSDAALGMKKTLNKVAFIFKTGDDLRQDSLILQMISVMDDLWKKKGHDLKMTVYKVVPTEQDQGLIEFVSDAVTICKVQAKEACKNATGDIARWVAEATATFKGDVIYNWLKHQNSEEAKLKKALDNFMFSCAGYTVAMFVLGIGDRHNDNIMLRPNGKLFHIDFGHVMGNFKRKYFAGISILRERSPMLLPRVFVQVIHSGGEGQFERFRELCETAYLILRKDGSLLISLLAMMLSTGMPELQAEADLEYMRTQLQLDQSSEEQALKFFQREFNSSLKKGYTVTTNWWTHAINQM